MPLSKIQKVNSCLGWQEEERDGRLKITTSKFSIFRENLLMDDSFHWASGKECWTLFLYSKMASSSRCALVNRRPSIQTTPAVLDTSSALLLTLLFQLLRGSQLYTDATWQHLALLHIGLPGICWNLLSHSDVCAHLEARVTLDQQKSLDKHCPLSALEGTILTCTPHGSSQGSQEIHLPTAVTSFPSLPISFFLDSHSCSLGSLP